MNARLAEMLTLAHAPAWRRRYGREFCALLEDLPATPAVVASATTSALSTQTPALVTIGGVLLAAVALAFGPVASDRTVMSKTAAPRTAKPAAAHAARVACSYDVAFVTGDASAGC